MKGVTQTKTGPGPGRPPNTFEQQRKSLLLALESLQLPPTNTAQEFLAALEAAIQDPSKWKSKASTIAAVAEYLDRHRKDGKSSLYALERHVYPRKRKKPN